MNDITKLNARRVGLLEALLTATRNKDARRIESIQRQLDENSKELESAPEAPAETSIIELVIEQSIERIEHAMAQAKVAELLSPLKAADGTIDFQQALDTLHTAKIESVDGSVDVVLESAVDETVEAPTKPSLMDKLFGPRG